MTNAPANSPDAPSIPARRSWARILRAVFKWTLFAVVLAYVGRHGYRLWIQNEGRQASLSPAGVGWLVGSAGAYTIGWLPSVWFWRRLMQELGGSVSFTAAARAYYCGQLGKYIPGKAMVLVIRSAMVKDHGCGVTTAALTAAYETLTMMGTGAAVGAALAPLLFRPWLEARAPNWSRPFLSHSTVTAAAVVVVVGASLPLASRLLTAIAVKATPGDAIDASSRVRIPSGLIAAGCAAFVCSWLLQGISLGMTLRAVGDASLNFADWPLWTGATALSTSLGFAVLFAPGGLGVREGILLSILDGQPGITAEAAVAATVLSRVVSFLAEVVVSSLLYATARTEK